MRDAELKKAAVHKAGGATALSRLLGVSPGAVSQWGRTRPIPRHVRPRLEDYVKPTRSAPAEEGPIPSTTVQHLLKLFEPNAARSWLARLPSRYRKQYEQRVAEVIARVKRELKEYQAVLEAEHRTHPRRGKTRRTQGEL
jgi:hypothetical protein